MTVSFRRKLIALSTLACIGLTGCYGQFGLTRKLYNWNGQATGNKFANSAILWALLIIPVYELASLGDFLIFNTIEVFTGSNPVAMNKDGSLDTHYADRDYHLQRLADGRVEVSVNGKPVYRYREMGGKLAVEDLNGKLVRVIPAQTRVAKVDSAATVR
jgi:hypothetical protein